MKVCDILRKDKILLKLDGSGKENAINSLVDLFKGDERVKDLDQMREAVLEREKIMSTGVGHGFAIPHAKTDAVNEIVAGFAKLPEPIDFEALDGEPVNLVFLLVGEENAVGKHIKMLSRVSRLMNKESFRVKLAEAQNEDEIFKIFEEEEKDFLDLG